MSGRRKEIKTMTVKPIFHPCTPRADIRNPLEAFFPDELRLSLMTLLNTMHLEGTKWFLFAFILLTGFLPSLGCTFIAQSWDYILSQKVYWPAVHNYNKC
jgi:hypothetical protein